jgi:hypothetical protein
MALTILAVIPSKGTLIVLLSAGFLIQQHVRFVTRQRKISSISSFLVCLLGKLGLQFSRGSTC